MKKIFLLLLFLMLISINIIAQVQTTRYTKVVRNIFGVPVTGLNIDLYSSGTETKLYDLVEDANSPGTYYHATVSIGQYDLYIGNVLKEAGIWIGGNKLSIIAGKFNTSGRLSTDGIQDDAVTSGKIANRTINSTDINLLAVSEDNIKDAAVTERKLSINAVNEDNIINNSVTTNKIPDANITLPKLSQTVLDYILSVAGGGTITINNLPDDITLNMTSSDPQLLQINPSWILSHITLPLSDKLDNSTGAITLGDNSESGYTGTVYLLDGISAICTVSVDGSGNLTSNGYEVLTDHSVITMSQKSDSLYDSRFTGYKSGVEYLSQNTTQQQYVHSDIQMTGELDLTSLVGVGNAEFIGPMRHHGAAIDTIASREYVRNKVIALKEEISDLKSISFLKSNPDSLSSFTLFRAKTNMIIDSVFTKVSILDTSIIEIEYSVGWNIGYGTDRSAGQDFYTLGNLTSMDNNIGETFIPTGDNYNKNISTNDMIWLNINAQTNYPLEFFCQIYYH